MKRKHRVVVEITFDEPCTDKEAARHIRGVLDGSFWPLYHKRAGVTRWEVKQGERVIRAEKKKAWKENENSSEKR